MQHFIKNMSPFDQQLCPLQVSMENVSPFMLCFAEHVMFPASE